MAKMGVNFVKGKSVWLVILCAVLLLTTVTHAMRPLETVGRLEGLNKNEESKPSLVNAEETEQKEVDCVNVDEEECMIKRTLAAHTDYIYTQQHVEVDDRISWD
eukprot:Gb_37548 [translate_table: standard]